MRPNSERSCGRGKGSAEEEREPGLWREGRDRAQRKDSGERSWRGVGREERNFTGFFIQYFAKSSHNKKRIFHNSFNAMTVRGFQNDVFTKVVLIISLLIL